MALLHFSHASYGSIIRFSILLFASFWDEPHRNRQAALSPFFCATVLASCAAVFTARAAFLAVSLAMQLNTRCRYSREFERDPCAPYKCLSRSKSLHGFMIFRPCCRMPARSTESLRAELASEEQVWWAKAV